MLNVTASAPTVTKPTPSRLRKVSLGGVAKAAEAKPAGKSYPQIPDDSVGTISKLAGDLRREKELYESLEGSIKAKTQELKSRVVPFYFATNTGKHDVPSSVRCAIRRRHDLPLDPVEHAEYEAKMKDNPQADAEVGAVLVAFINKYPAADETAIVGVIGDENVQSWFRQKFELKIDGDKLPADHAEAIVQKLQAVLAEYGCPAAMTAAEKVVPIETFHTARHSLFDTATNEQLDLVLPCQTQLKVKNVMRAADKR